jgi:hypothetical protein
VLCVFVGQIAQIKLRHYQKEINMPIEIKELHIKMLVEDDKQKVNNTSAAEPATQMDAIVAECVEQVLTILKEKEGR